MFLIRFIFLTSFIFCLLCPFVQAEDGSIGKKPRVGVFVYRLDDSYINLVSKAIENKLKSSANYAVFDGSNNPVLQLEQIISFLNGPVDGVAINLVDIKLAQNVINIVRSKGIPIVFFNKEPDLNVLKRYKNAHYVGTEAVHSGTLQGDIIAEIWKNNPKFDKNNDNTCNFIMLQGNIDSPEALLRTKVSVQRARAHGVNMQQIGDTLVCDWNEDCAYTSTKIALNAYIDDVDFIISNNDGMALGAVRALNDYGLNLDGGDKSIPVVGIDAIEQAKAAISKGMMHGTVVQSADAMGGAIAKMLINAMDNKPWLEGLPYEWDSNNISIRIPYEKYKPQ